VKTAIIGVGNIGPAVAGHLVDGGERVVLAASDKPDIFAKQLGELTSTASVPEAIEAGHVVIFAVWFDVMKALIAQDHARLSGKVVVNPSNPISMKQKGEFSRTLPDGGLCRLGDLRDAPADGALRRGLRDAFS
jgi:predicted dinucleotide-binding enzyme